METRTFQNNFCIFHRNQRLQKAQIINISHAMLKTRWADKWNHNRLKESFCAKYLSWKLG